MAATPKATSFSQRAREYATRQLIAYYDALRLKNEWYATNMAADIYLVINRAEELINDLEANNKAKLNTLVKAANAPGDWR